MKNNLKGVLGKFLTWEIYIMEEENDEGALLFSVTLCCRNLYLADLACGSWDTDFSEEW
jgi:hypothetical protein